jgi:hypothetical protein
MEGRSVDDRQKLAETVRSGFDSGIREWKEAEAALAVLAQPCQECEALRGKLAEAERRVQEEAGETCIEIDLRKQAEQQIKNLSYGKKAESTRANFWKSRADQAEQQLEQTREALRWCRESFDTVLSGKPLRAVTEMRSFVDAALSFTEAPEKDGEA